VARRLERLEALAAELSSTNGIRAEAISVDLTDADSRRRLPDELSGRDLTVDVLVNNAGFSTTGPVQQSGADREVAMIRTNVEAVIDLCSRFIPGMAERRRGAVLNVASTAAFQPLPGQAGYAATKAFVLSYSRAIGAELRGTGVTVTALCPGPVQTEFIEKAGLDGDAEMSLPKFMWVPAPDVARAAIEGMARGRAVVIPGSANRLGATAAHLVPRSLLMPLLARQHPSLKS